MFDRDRLLELVWGAGYFGGGHIVDVHVANLRKKLGDAANPGYVETVRGIGYRFARGQVVPSLRRVFERVTSYNIGPKQFLSHLVVALTGTLAFVAAFVAAPLVDERADHLRTSEAGLEGGVERSDFTGGAW